MKFFCKFVLFLSLCVCIAKSTDPLGEFCEKDTQISKSSKLSQNIKNLLAELALQAPKTGFVTTFSGKGQDRVYGLVQCRGDVSKSDCSNCVKSAAVEIRNRCPNNADARIWYDFCFLRYKNDCAFVGQVDTSPGIFYFNVESVADPESFNRELGGLMERVRKQATEPRNKGLGKGDTVLSPFSTLYALGQCTRDLTPIDCAQCLAIAVGNFPKFCENRKGCRVLYSSCYVRYELYPFFFPLPSNNTSVEDRSRVTIVHS